MQMLTGPRAELARLITERREDYAGLSRLLGRNPAYIQQFIKRGSPRRLDEGDVITLAAYSRGWPAALGARVAAEVADGLIRVPRYDIGASAGHGAVHD